MLNQLVASPRKSSPFLSVALWHRTQWRSRTGYTSRTKPNARGGPYHGVGSTGSPANAIPLAKGSNSIGDSWQPMHVMRSPGMASIIEAKRAAAKFAEPARARHLGFPPQQHGSHAN